MPRRFQMGDLVTMCQQRVDKENDEHIQTTEWKRLISSQYGDLWNEVAKTGLRYFETREAIATTGAASYQEPSSHLSTVGIDRVYSDGSRRELTELMAQERNVFAGRTGDAVCFELVDDQLYLYPVPPNGQSYEWLYIPQPPDLSSFADTELVDVVTPDGEEFLIWGVAVKALHKEEADLRAAREEREAARVRLAEWAILRSLHSQRVRQVADEDMFGWGAEAEWRYNR